MTVSVVTADPRSCVPPRLAVRAPDQVPGRPLDPRSGVIVAYATGPEAVVVSTSSAAMTHRGGRRAQHGPRTDDERRAPRPVELPTVLIAGPSDVRQQAGKHGVGARRRTAPLTCW